MNDIPTLLLHHSDLPSASSMPEGTMCYVLDDSPRYFYCDTLWVAVSGLWIMYGGEDMDALRTRCRDQIREIVRRGLSPREYP